MLLAAALLLTVATREARADDRPGVQPVYYQRALTEADVAGRPLRELAIMRNTIFARAGQPFRKKWLHDYFSAFDWYKPKGIVDPQTLGPIDQQNADFLSRYEIALPRAELERRLQAIQGRHVNAAAGEPLAIAFAADGKRALLADGRAIRLVDLPSGQPTVTWWRSFKAVGLVPQRLRAVALNAVSQLETIDLASSGSGKVMTSPSPRDAHGRTGVFSNDGRLFLGGPVYAIVDTGDGDGDGESESEQELADGSIVAIDAASGKLLFKRETEEGRPCLAFTTDAIRALVTEVGAVSLWDVATGKTIWTNPHAGPSKLGGSCTAAAISPDGATAVVSWRTGAQLLDAKSGKILRPLALPPPRALAFSPRGDRLLAGGGGLGADDKPWLAIADVERGTRLRALPSAGNVTAVAWSPDGARVLSDGSHGPALWDAATGKALAGAFAGHETWWNREEQIEVVLLSRALGRPLAMFSQLDFERTPFDAPELLDELVPIAELKTMSRRDLRLLRNTVYARRGRAFRSPILRDYFERLDWYKIDPAYTDARLTKIDRRNIKLIQSAEIELGGPINDRQHQEEDVPEA